MDNNKKAALVLSGGGARGMAHIGVIEALLEKGFTISSISGCSIGSLIGGIYASGKLKEYKEWMSNKSKLDIFKLMDFALSKSGLIKGEKVFREMKSFLHDGDIRDLSIPYAAVAVDVLTQEEVVFTSGSLHDAIRASVAIPTVLQPLKFKGQLLIDGGVLSPLPLDALQRSPGDVVIAVDLSSPIEYMAPAAFQKEDDSHPVYQKAIQVINDKWSSHIKPKKTGKQGNGPGYFDIINLSIYAMQRKLTEDALIRFPPDVLVPVSSKACDTFEFHRTDELIAYGRQQFDIAYQQWEEKRGKNERIPHC